MINHQDYLDGKVSHREYWAQFVDEEVKKELLSYITIKELKASKDKYFNDIPLKKWDDISGVVFIGSSLVNGPRVRRELAEKLREAGEGVSPASMVCIYKEMARQLVRPNSII